MTPLAKLSDRQLDEKCEHVFERKSTMFKCMFCETWRDVRGKFGAQASTESRVRELLNKKAEAIALAFGYEEKE